VKSVGVESVADTVVGCILMPVVTDMVVDWVSLDVEKMETRRVLSVTADEGSVGALASEVRTSIVADVTDKSELTLTGTSVAVTALDNESVTLVSALIVAVSSMLVTVQAVLIEVQIEVSTAVAAVPVVVKVTVVAMLLYKLCSVQANSHYTFCDIS
jgi:hypothetical protein